MVAGKQVGVMSSEDWLIVMIKQLSPPCETISAFFLFSDQHSLSPLINPIVVTSIQNWLSKAAKHVIIVNLINTV